MNNSTKITVALGVLFSAGLVLAQAPDSDQAPAAAAPQTAQPQPGVQQRNPGQMAAHLGQRLGLSSDQVAQITPIIADRQQKIESLRSDESLTPNERRTKARAIIGDSNSKIEAVLTDAQKQQYEQMLANRRNHRHNSQTQPQA